VIAADARPASKLGGAGRFAPSLFSHMVRRFPQDRFSAIFCGSIHRAPQDISFCEPQQGELSRGLLKRLVNRMPWASIALRSVARMDRSRRLLRFVRNGRVDCIHSHDFGGAHLLAHAGIPNIMTVHSKGSLYREWIAALPDAHGKAWMRYFEGIERESIRSADMITFPSLSAALLLKDDYPDLTGTIDGKTRIVHTGIDIEAFAGQRPATHLENEFCLSLGNHIADKGVDLSLRLFANIALNHPELRFVNAGSFGPETDRLRGMANDLGVSDRCDFLGTIPFDDVCGLLRQCRCLIHMPRRVVFDLVLLEAMYLGALVVASSAPGNIEALGREHIFVVDVRDGILYPRFEMESIMASPQWQESIARNRERVVMEFSQESMLDSYHSLYQEAIDTFPVGKGHYNT
jgi:glycosyltransferase involved in cell wall biosynthesis